MGMSNIDSGAVYDYQIKPVGRHFVEWLRVREDAWDDVYRDEVWESLRKLLLKERSLIKTEGKIICEQSQCLNIFLKRNTKELVRYLVGMQYGVVYKDWMQIQRNYLAATEMMAKESNIKMLCTIYQEKHSWLNASSSLYSPRNGWSSVSYKYLTHIGADAFLLPDEQLNPDTKLVKALGEEGRTGFRCSTDDVSYPHRMKFVADLANTAPRE